MDIYRDAKRLGIYPPLFTSPSELYIIQYFERHCLSSSGCSKLWLLETGGKERRCLSKYWIKKKYIPYTVLSALSFLICIKKYCWSEPSPRSGALFSLRLVLACDTSREVIHEHLDSVLGAWGPWRQQRVFRTSLLITVIPKPRKHDNRTIQEMRLIWCWTFSWGRSRFP